MDKRKSFVVDIDRDSYFTQYAWALENFDLRAVFNDFLETEKGIIDEASRQKLWEDYKKANDDGVVTELQMDVLSYVMKYEKGVYKKGQTVAEVYDGHGRIHLLEPGYYFIEVKGASGLSARNRNTNLANSNQIMSGIKNENPTRSVQNSNVVRFYNRVTRDEYDYDCCFYVDDELNFVFEIKEGENWKYTYGWLEANQKFLFLYQIGPTEVLSIKKELEDIQFAERSDDDPFVLFDFCEWNDDPLKEDFGSFKFVVNKISLKELKLWEYDISSFLCGMDEEATQESLSKLSALKGIHPGTYYYDVIKNNIKLKSGKLFTYSNALDNNKEYNYFNHNYLHGGDGGLASTIIYIDKATLFDYNIGDPDFEETGNYGLAIGSTTTYLKSVSNTSDQMILCAEQGLHATEEGIYIQRENTFSLLSQNNEGPTQGWRDDASKDFSKKVNSHLGENFDYDGFSAGAGRGAICIKGQVVHQCVGGGELGEGLRLNEFYDAYYQGKQKGSIRIKYLCAKYARKFKADFHFDGDKVRPLFYIGDYIPIGENFNLKISTNGMTGGFSSVPTQAINRTRTINYLSFDLETSKFQNGETAQLDFTEYSPTKVYINLKEDNGHFKYHGSLKEEIFDPFIGIEPGQSLNLAFTMTDSISFLNYLLFAYNSAYSEKVTLKISSFNSTTYDLLLTLSEYSNFKFMNVFEEIIQLSFKYKNEIPLNDYFDIYGQKVLNSVVAKVEGLDYSLVDPSYKNFTAYVEGYKFLVPKYTKLYLKFKFNTSRVCLDTDLSTFFGAIEYYKKNIDFSHKIILDSYFSAGSEDNFQCIEFIPSTSQDIQIYIKKYTFTLDLFSDLYNNIFINNLSSKTEFEVGESALLSVKLKNFERVSHLLNRCYIGRKDNENDTEYKDSNIEKFFGKGAILAADGEKNITGYSFYESLHKFESFIAFKDGKIIRPYEYNIIDTNIPHFLNRRGCNGVGVGLDDQFELVTEYDAETGKNQKVKKWILDGGDAQYRNQLAIVDSDDTHDGYRIERWMRSPDYPSAILTSEKGLSVQSSRNFGQDLQLPGSLTKISTTNLYNLSADSPLLKTDFSKITLVSQNIVAEEDVLIVLTFKECNMEIRLSSDYMPGQKIVAVENGQTANVNFFKPYNFMFLMAGGPTGNGEAGGDGDYRGAAPYAGGFGGDGYIGGTGGMGADAKDWTIELPMFKLLGLIEIPNILGIQLRVVKGAPGGLGGRGFLYGGTPGASGGSTLGNFYFEWPDEWKLSLYRDQTSMYCGKHMVKPFLVYKTKDDLKKISASLKAGSQGLSLNKARAHMNGRGGGGGIGSTFNITSNNHFFKSNDSNYYGINGNYYSIVNSLSAGTPYKSIYVDGGFPGLCRGLNAASEAFLHGIEAWYLISKTESGGLDWSDIISKVTGAIGNAAKGAVDAAKDGINKITGMKSNQVRRLYSSGIFGSADPNFHDFTDEYWNAGRGFSVNRAISPDWSTEHIFKIFGGQIRQAICTPGYDGLGSFYSILQNTDKIIDEYSSRISEYPFYTRVGYCNNLTDEADKLYIVNSNETLQDLSPQTLNVHFTTNDNNSNYAKNMAINANIFGNASYSKSTGVVRIDAYMEPKEYVGKAIDDNGAPVGNIQNSYTYKHILAGEPEIITSKFAGASAPDGN